MARERPLRHALAYSVLCGAVVLGLIGATAGAAGADGPGGIPVRSRCPDSEAVWSTVTALVPGATARLATAQPHVEIVDLGAKYRVRVTTDAGVLERTYTDPDRDCEKRRRFAAEFIVLSLFPPELAVDRTAPSATPSPSGTAAPSAMPAPSATPAPSSSAPPAPPVAPVPTAAPQPPPPVTPPIPVVPPAHHTAAAPPRPSGAAFARIELSALGEASPPVFRAPGFVAWGVDLRARLGAGRFGAIAGVSYWPRVDFVASGVRGSVTRVPAIVGARARAVARYVEVAGDLGVAVAFERYDGLSPHDPSGGARVAPGLEAAVLVSSRPLAGFAPVVELRVDWFPLVQELAAAPQGNLGNTPSLWIGAALGVSWER